MKEFIIFVCIDSTEIFFSKLRSAGLNYNLPSFFTESYCAGVSNKHCLLTFFIAAVMHNLLCRVVFTVDKLYWYVFILPIDGVYSMFTIIILFGLLSTDA